MREDRIKIIPKVIELTKKYPFLFKEGCLRSGFYLPVGWEPLIDSLCVVIENHLEHIVPEEIRGEIYVVQVKEKFGTLRFYMNESTPFIDGAIALAETLSFYTCDMCGKAGTMSNIRVLCDSHKASEKNRKEEAEKKYAEEQRARKTLKKSAIK